MRKLQVISVFTLLCSSFWIFSSCARMGNPDGGWYDETPPQVIGASPADRGTNAKSNKVYINFNEFIKVDNATEKVVISPPQMEQAEIKASGKRIVVELKDTLKENTTYTIDFSDAISDNNEGNPMGNYTYSFSTGNEIDTMEVSGTVLAAEDLEPVKGMLVGLYEDTSDSAFTTKPMLRVSRTDSQGHFVIRGIKNGSYRVFALQDADGDYKYTQASEAIAFSHDIISPYSKPDVRQDTIWADTLHIRDIKQVPYIHYFPDNIVLRSFTKEAQDRFFLKSERKDADHFQLFFTGPSKSLPRLEGLNFNSMDAFIVEASPKKDTITYWLRDTALVNQDTLHIAMTHEATDTLGNISEMHDTLEVLSKVSYAKRMKKQQEEYEEWYKKLEKKRKRSEHPELIDSIYPSPRLQVKYSVEQSMAPNGRIRFSVPSPLARLDTSAFHLYAKQDSLWYRARFELRKAEGIYATDREFQVLAEWIPGTEYSFEVDTLAMEDIYGKTTEPYKAGLKVKTQDEFSALFITVSGISLDASSADSASAVRPQIIVQLLNSSDKVEMEATVVDGTAEFYYVKPGEYYLRAFVDRNGNGVWNTGDYSADLQPEEVYYYNEKLECRANWDVKRSWNLTSRPLDRQKPDKLTKQKGDKKKTIKQRNLERAKKLGIALPEYLR